MRLLNSKSAVLRNALYSALCFSTFASPVNAEKAKVFDSHRTGLSSSFAQSVYWVDNFRVLFLDFRGRHASRPDGGRQPISTLSVWNPDSGLIEDRGDAGTNLCYVNGYVRYSRWISKEGKSLDSVEVLAGDLGQEMIVRDVISPPDYLDRYTCRRASERSLPDWTRGQRVVLLRSGDGFFVLGQEKDDRNSPVEFHPSGGRRAVLMPFRRREADFALTQYEAYKGAYLIGGTYFVEQSGHPLGGFNISPWPKGMPIPVWWLYPDGRVEEIRLPTEARVGVRFFGAQPGIFLIAHGSGTNKDGLFAVLPDSLTEILRGRIDAYSVSPNGCRIAVLHDEHYSGKRDRGTVKVVDVCHRGP